MRHILPRALQLLTAVFLTAVAILGVLQIEPAFSSSSSGKLSAEDRLDIMELYGRYSRDLDNAMADDMVTNVFSPTAQVQDPGTCANGTAQLRDFATRYARGDHYLAHMPYNILIEGSGNHATGRSYLMEFSQQLPFPPGTIPTLEERNPPVGTPRPGGTDRTPYWNPQVNVSWMGTYTDTFIKLNGKWLIQSRHIWVQRPTTTFAECPTDLLKEATIFVGKQASTR